jgi:hypothetical protein
VERTQLSDEIILAYFVSVRDNGNLNISQESGTWAKLSTHALQWRETVHSGRSSIVHSLPQGLYLLNSFRWGEGSLVC